MRNNKKGWKFYICPFAFIFFILPFAIHVKAESGDSGFIQKPEVENRRQTNSARKKKKGKLKGKLSQSKSDAVTPGVWGAAGVNLIIEDGGATIEYDCARAEITQKFSVNERGGFKLNGVYIRRNPGALRVKFQPQPQPAIFEGEISGNKMTLRVTLTETNKTLDQVVLERGKTARLHKCY
jgi:hypothetical protein